MPLTKRTQGLIARAVRMRWETVLLGGSPRAYEAVAEALGVTERTLRRWRQTDAWAAELSALDCPEQERELVGQAKATLRRLMMDKDPKVALGAARAVMDFCLARKLEVEHRGEVVYLRRYDVSGVAPETLHRWISEATEAEGIGPGAGRALPEPPPEPVVGVVEGEFVEVVGEDG